MLEGIPYMAILKTTDQEQIIAILALDHDVISRKEATDLLERCRQDGQEPLAELLSEHRQAADDLLRAIGEELGYPYFDMANAGAALKADPSLLEDVNLDALDRYTAMPMRSDDAGTVVVVIGDPTNPAAKGFLEKEYQDKKDLNIRYAIANPFHIRRELASLRTKLASDEIALMVASESPEDTLDFFAVEDEDSVENSPVIKFVSHLMETALHRRASDIHVNPNGDGSYTALYRIDGVLQRASAPPRHRETEVVAQIMYRAEMDPSNLRFPQDGRLKFESSGRTIDGRVSMLPQVGGPKLTVRLLDPANLDMDLGSMGLSEHTLKVLRSNSHRKQGAMLVSGPTGSGKTTTLYSLLREIQTVEKNIMTVEDPVEYQIRGLNQIQVEKGKGQGVTFAGALRAMMRSDPDIILVGEIRDGETARIAADASITGHLVLSTIHAPSAVEVFTRFIEMGVPSYVAAEAVTVTSAQRLMRRVCQCSEVSEPTEEEITQLTIVKRPIPDLVAHTRGCGICNGVGYLGRLAVAEVLEVSDEIKRLIADGAPTHDVRAAAQDEGFIPLTVDAYRHVVDHNTTIGEFMRVIDMGGLV